MALYTIHSDLREEIWRISVQAEPSDDLVPLENIAIRGWFRGGSEVVPKSGTAVFPSLCHSSHLEIVQARYEKRGSCHIPRSDGRRSLASGGGQHQTERDLARLFQSPP